MPWRWRTRCRIPLAWRLRGVGQPMVHQLRRDVPAVHEQAEAAVALSTEQGFPLWAAWGTSLRGWALAMQGQGEEGMAQVRQGIAACRATGTALLVPYLCTVLADVCDHLGHTEDGLQALAEAHTTVRADMRNAGGKRKSVGCGASCSCGSRGRRRRRRKPGYNGPWTSPAARRRNPWSCGPP